MRIASTVQVPTRSETGVWMFKRGSAVLVSLLAVAYLAVGAADALAGGHAGLISFRSCNSVLVAADFEDDLEEISAPTFIRSPGMTAEASSCKYGALGEGDASGVKEFSDGGLGVECVANLVRLAGEEKMAPEGGCYRIAGSSLLVSTGSKATKLLPTLRKGVRDKAWPTGYARYVASGIGNHAEFGYDHEGKGYAYLQVLNATLLIETNGNVSLLHILRLAAAAL